MKTVHYKVVRFRPHYGLDEFVNIGVLVYLPWLAKAKALFTQNLDKAKALNPDMDTKDWHSFLKDLARLFNERAENIIATEQDVLEGLFKTLIPVTEGTLFLSETRKSLIPDTKDPLDFIFNINVKDAKSKLSVEEKTPRTDLQILNVFKPILTQHHVWDKLKKHTVNVTDGTIDFKHAWKNGIWHAYEVLPLKGKEKDDHNLIYQWRGKVDALVESGEAMRLAFLTTTNNTLDFARRNITKESGAVKVEFYTEKDAEAFASNEEALIRESAGGHIG
jgi:hypothetical protein